MTASVDAKISVIIPVLNESAAINTVIAHIRALDDGSLVEIIVVDGDPDGGTIKAVRDRSVVTATSPKGRGRQMNHGASLAAGDIIVFLHADTVMPRDGLRKIRNTIADGHDAGAFSLGIQSTRWVFRVTEQYAALRTRLTGIPFGDQAFFFRRDYFRSQGGFADIPIMEDVDCMRRIRKKGDAVCIIPDKVMTSARRWEEEGLIFCTIRNWCLQLLYTLGVHPDRLAGWYK